MFMIFSPPHYLNRVKGFCYAKHATVLRVRTAGVTNVKTVSGIINNNNNNITRVVINLNVSNTAPSPPHPLPAAREWPDPRLAPTTINNDNRAHSTDNGTGISSNSNTSNNYGNNHDMKIDLGQGQTSAVILDRRKTSNGRGNHSSKWNDYRRRRDGSHLSNSQKKSPN